MNITKKIHDLREERGWSVAKLARQTGIPTVSLRVMLSRDDPNSYNVKSLTKIAKVFGVTVSYLTATEADEKVANLSEGQKQELIDVVSQAIKDYFNANRQAENQAEEESK